MSKTIAIVLATTIMMLACAPERSKAALEGAGMTSITTKGWAPFNCGHGDMFSTGFEAKNANGQKVDGVVCCGLLIKRCTVRY